MKIADFRGTKVCILPSRRIRFSHPSFECMNWKWGGFFRFWNFWKINVKSFNSYSVFTRINIISWRQKQMQKLIQAFPRVEFLTMYTKSICIIQCPSKYQFRIATCHNSSHLDRLHKNLFEASSSYNFTFMFMISIRYIVEYLGL